MPQIRTWRPADLPTLMQMAVTTAWNISPPEEKVPELYPAITRNAAFNLIGVLSSPGGTAFVADVGGRPVGYLLIGIQPDERSGMPAGYLADIYVEPAYRRKGVSRDLHKAGEAYLRQLDLKRVTNWVHAHNAAGQGTGSALGLKLHALLLYKDLRQ